MYLEPKQHFMRLSKVILKAVFNAAILVSFSGLSLYGQALNSSELVQLTKKLAKSKKDTSKVELLLKLSLHYIFKPGEEKSDMDSAFMLTETAAALSRKLKYDKGIAGSCLNYGINYREMGQRGKGKLFTESAIALSRKYGLHELLGESYIELGQYPDKSALGLKEWLIQRTACYENAFAAFQQSGNKERQGFCMKNLADFSQVASNYPLAINQARQAIELYKAAGSVKLQGCYDLLNICYSSFSDYPSAIKYGLLALQAAEQVNDTTIQLSTTYARLGLAFSRSKTNEKEALRYYLKGYAIAEKYKSLPHLYNIAANIVISYNELERYDEALHFADELIQKYPGPFGDPDFELAVDRMYLGIHLANKNFGEAKKRCEQMIANWSKTPENNTYGINDVIRYFLGTEQYPKAERWLKRIDTLIYQRGRMDRTGYITNLKMWFELDSSRGNYFSAISYLLKHQRIQDSVYDDNKSKMIETLRIEYETAGKDKDIALLTATAGLQKEELSRSKLLRNMTIVGILLLAVFLIILYRQYRHKMRANIQIGRQNQDLQHLVKEKEWLLKEIHHRVKNNLQTVVSLLESQSAYLQSDALAAIQDSQNRVHAMSLVHQKLYQSDNIASINMGQYLPELINYLKSSFSSKKISFNFQEIADVDIDVSQAIPIGLIVNEAVSNAIKYAFPQERNTGEIRITLQQAADQQLVLLIRDNGIGLPSGFDTTAAGGLGLRLMKGLTEDIGGIFSIDSASGTTITVSFTVNAPFYRSNAVNTKLKNRA
jgi:two-component sensor histidine kinase